MDIDALVYDVLHQVKELEYGNDELSEKEMFQDLAFDSVDIMNLIDRLEERFDIFIENDEVMELTRSVKEIIELVKRKKDYGCEKRIEKC